MSKSAASSEVKPKQTPLMVAILPSVFIYVAAVILVLFARDDLASTTQYWEFFLPVVAFVSLLSGWSQAYALDRSRFVYMIKQILHWGAFGSLLWALQEHGVRDAITAEQFNLTQLYVLALAALVAGLYLDTRMFLFGLFIGCCAYVLADPANIAVLNPLGEALKIANPQEKPQTMIIAVAALAFVASFLVQLSTRGAIMAKRARKARS
ncbi:hypothetical protein MARPU_03285 [Marichromatium purpuratum 984]|uniref:Uncharacterized protein n=1 Tax=Marichromatium purpuratum 984 TaxID=765910 RepID=W0E0E2_MARPU|nr:hypothetical protein [Marichromatium purpuratum]AHF03003.1 hypothetical protein MARPU_03285 [Marichromatium purpuratum 984]